MKSSATDCLLELYDEQHELEDYQSGVPRWCTGCGDNAILTAVQRLCRDEALRPEKTVERGEGRQEGHGRITLPGRSQLRPDTRTVQIGPAAGQLFDADREISVDAPGGAPILARL